MSDCHTGSMKFAGTIPLFPFRSTVHVVHPALTRLHPSWQLTICNEAARKMVWVKTTRCKHCLTKQVISFVEADFIVFLGSVGVYRPIHSPRTISRFVTPPTIPVGSPRVVPACETEIMGELSELCHSTKLIAN